MKIQISEITLDVERIKNISFHNDDNPFIHIIDQDGACHSFDGDDFVYCNFELDSNVITIQGRK